MLSVYIDFKSPAAYLALSPTLALAERFDLSIDWRPFRTVERDVPKLGKEETVGESHRRVRAAALRWQFTKYAKRQGIELNYPAHLGGTDLALGVLASAEKDPLSFIRAAFSAYWTEHLDLDDPATVAHLIDLSGIGVRLDEEELRARLDESLEVADEIGVVGAPAYYIADQIFVGREHLPWIDEILRGTDAPSR